MEKATTRQFLIRLREILVDYFSVEELRTLCFDLGIDYDDLPGGGRAAKARELVAYLKRHSRIDELLEVGKLQRPDIAWPKDIVPSPPVPRADVCRFVLRLALLISLLLLCVISTDTPVPGAQSVAITISNEGFGDIIALVTEPYSLLDSISVKGDTPVTIAVQPSDQYGKLVEPTTLIYHWESCCRDKTNKPPIDTRTYVWTFQPPTYLLTETITVTVLDDMSCQVTVTIPFTITER